MFNFGNSSSTSGLDQANSWSQVETGMGLQSLKANSPLETDTFSYTQGRSADYSNVDTRAISSSIATESTGITANQIVQAGGYSSELTTSPFYRHLGQISGNLTVNSTSTFAATYSFFMEMGSLRATLSGLSANADIRLVRDSDGDEFARVGEAIVYSTNTSTNNEYISLDGLGRGIYYLQVWTHSGTTPFRLNLNVTEGTRDFESESNNSLETADTIDGDYKVNLNGPRFFRGALNSTTDTVDYWRFKVDSPSQFKATLSGLSSDANLELLDAGGRPLFSSNQPGVFVDTVQSYRLDTGTYFLKITKAGAGTTPYNLDAIAVPYTWSSDTNLGITVKRVRALDNFDLIGQADFNVGIHTTDPTYGYPINKWSGVLDNTDDRSLSLHMSGEDIGYHFSNRYVPFTLKVYDRDGASSNDYADLSPIAGVRDLELTYDAMLDRIYDSTGRYYGKANQDITVQGNGDSDRAAITFNVAYRPTLI